MEGRCVTERHQVPGGWMGGNRVFCRDVRGGVRGCGGEGRPEALSACSCSMNHLNHLCDRMCKTRTISGTCHQLENWVYA
jgi:hypothetical protein